MACCAIQWQTFSWVQQKTRKFMLYPILKTVLWLPNKTSNKSQWVTSSAAYLWTCTFRASTPSSLLLVWGSVTGLLCFWVQRCFISKMANLHSRARQLLSAIVQQTYPTAETKRTCSLLPRMSRLRTVTLNSVKTVWRIFKNRLYLWNSISSTLLRCTVLQNVVKTHHARDLNSKSLE